ncbi:MAG TPA: anti-sigma factor antagonist [Firmicutes bacterium]|nr:anti-sigma factor antagonist [Bacillota bacterium]
MHYSLEIAGQALIATLSGELDLHTSPAFKKDVARSFAARPQLKHLIINAKEMSFIDSSGLGVILGRYRELEARGGRLYFVQANPRIKRILKLSGMEKIAEFGSSTQEILKRV